MVRNYNEDRVSVLLNAQQRFNEVQKNDIEHFSMFGVYDGHGGAFCCNYLKENLHDFLLPKFSNQDIENCIKKCFRELEDSFMKKAQLDYYLDTSGSCALIVLIIGIF